MNIIILSIIFIVASIMLYLSSEEIIKGLTRLSRYLGVTEFILSFFIIAVAASIPNLFVGVTSALRGLPELSFGDIMGNNIVALSVGIGLATLFSKKKKIRAENETIKGSTIFTFISALLPLILIYDGVLSRTDGLILIAFFVYYMYWIFSKKERFSKIYEEHEVEIVKETSNFFKDIFRVLGGFIVLLIAAQGIVYSSSEFAITLGLPLVMVGVLILGLGSALPEVYFAVSSARKDETGLILGNIMGAVIIPATLILGIVALISPIHGNDFELFAISRGFLFLATVVFFMAVKTHDEVSRSEAILLLLVYVGFVITTLMFY